MWETETMELRRWQIFVFFQVFPSHRHRPKNAARKSLTRLANSREEVQVLLAGASNLYQIK